MVVTVEVIVLNVSSAVNSMSYDPISVSKGAIVSAIELGLTDDKRMNEGSVECMNEEHESKDSIAVK